MPALNKSQSGISLEPENAVVLLVRNILSTSGISISGTDGSHSGHDKLSILCEITDLLLNIAHHGHDTLLKNQRDIDALSSTCDALRADTQQTSRIVLDRAESTPTSCKPRNPELFAAHTRPAATVRASTAMLQKPDFTKLDEIYSDGQCRTDIYSTSNNPPKLSPATSIEHFTAIHRVTMRPARRSSSLQPEITNRTDTPPTWLDSPDTEQSQQNICDVTRELLSDSLDMLAEIREHMSRCNTEIDYAPEYEQPAESADCMDPDQPKQETDLSTDHPLEDGPSQPTTVAEQQEPPMSAREELLLSIRRGQQLKKAQPAQPRADMGFTDSLRSALERRRTIRGTDPGQRLTQKTQVQSGRDIKLFMAGFSSSGAARHTSYVRVQSLSEAPTHFARRRLLLHKRRSFLDLPHSAARLFHAFCQRPSRIFFGVLGEYVGMCQLRTPSHRMILSDDVEALMNTSFTSSTFRLLPETAAATAARFCAASCCRSSACFSLAVSSSCTNRYFLCWTQTKAVRSIRSCVCWLLPASRFRTGTQTTTASGRCVEGRMRHAELLHVSSHRYFRHPLRTQGACLGPARRFLLSVTTARALMRT